jgi:hypothetical protein
VSSTSTNHYHVPRNLQPSHWQSPNIARFQREFSSYSNKTGRNINKEGRRKRSDDKGCRNILVSGETPVQVGTDTDTDLSPGMGKSKNQATCVGC